MTKVNQKKALELLLRNRGNEFKELAQALNFPTTENWEQIILQFSLQLNGCFVRWQGEGNTTTNPEVYKCFNLMRILSKNQKVTEVMKLLDNANKITEDFEIIRKEIGEPTDE